MNNPEYVKINDKRYKINTDFRIAIKCNSIVMDETIGDNERGLAIIYLLFGKEGLDDKINHNKLLQLAEKYLKCGKDFNDNKSNEEPDMDFEQDMGYIKASFRSDFNIDLDKEDMHYWTFMEYLNGLSDSEFGNCCVLNKIRNLRNYDTSQIKDAKERQKIENAKKKFALKKNIKPKEFTTEEQANMEAFRQQMGL